MDLEWIAMVNAYHAYHNTLVGNPAPMVNRMLERMKNPSPGDLVLELTTFRMYPRRQGQLGRLEKIEYEKPKDELNPDNVYYIRRPNGEVVRWRNADVIAIPEDTKFPEEAS